jgi:ABC-type Fe3+ transport system permease subunit
MSGDASALQLVLSADPALLRIVGLSLAVSLCAVGVAAVIGLPLGALVALTRYPGREASIVVLNALMGLPPVVVGVAVQRAGRRQAHVQPVWRDAGESRKASRREAESRPAIHRLTGLAGRPERHLEQQD